MERHGLTKILDNRCVCSCGDQFERLEGRAEIGEPPLTVRPRQPIEALHKGRWVCLRLPRCGVEIWPGYNSRVRPSLSLKSGATMFGSFWRIFQSGPDGVPVYLKFLHFRTEDADEPLSCSNFLRIKTGERNLSVQLPRLFMVPVLRLSRRCGMPSRREAGLDHSSPSQCFSLIPSSKAMRRNV